MYKIILASSSENRQYLLEQAGIPFNIEVSNADETIEAHLNPEELVMFLAEKKALTVCSQLKDYPSIIIAADTVIVYDNKPVGKPINADDAFCILRDIQNRMHSVYTGVAIIVTDYEGVTQSRKKVFYDKADVYMSALSDEVIAAYIATGEPFGRAGAYAIQGRAGLFIERISGDYNTVVGLPLSKLYNELAKLGIKLTDFWQ